MVTSEAIAAMKSMAMDPEKRLVLAKDSTCLGGLIIVLSNHDSQVVQLALQTLLLLSENREACRTVRSQLGVIEQLEWLMKSADHKSLYDYCARTHSHQSNESVKQLAKQLFHKLSEPSESSQTPLRDSSNLSRNTSNNHAKFKPTVKAKSIVLHIRGMTDRSDRELCSRLLLRVSGVISITFDMNRKHCILRTKADVKPEDLASSIAKSMTMIAQQVIRNEKGEESLVNFNLSGQSQVDKDVSSDLPDYLSDDSDHSYVDDLALKKPTDEDKKKSAGWFSAAANFLSNSFYW